MENTLTIIIPTFNRVNHLDFLLSKIIIQLENYKNIVTILVGNNNSEDNTAEILTKYQSIYKNFKILNHPINLGAEGNILQCLKFIDSKFFWVLGDDDLPRAGCIDLIINSLKNNPDYIFLESAWVQSIDASLRKTTYSDPPLLRPASSEDLCKKANIMLTFLSASVINRDTVALIKPHIEFERFNGTGLVHLGWILPLIIHGNSFCVIDNALFATTGNSGGYKALTVFGRNFPEIVFEIFGESNSLTKAIMTPYYWLFMPKLVAMLKISGRDRFEKENLFSTLQPIKRSLAFWILIVPIYMTPTFFLKLLRILKI